jgi:predicted RNA-binding protein with PUA-like domain
MASYWLIKSEPTTYAWDDLVKDGTTRWDGIRNPTARMHLRAMKKGDKLFFYHSGGPKEIVGTAVVAQTAYADPKDAAWACVDISVADALKKPVTLATLKAHKTLKNLVFVKQSRLSVSPVSATDAKAILALAK